MSHHIGDQLLHAAVDGVGWDSAKGPHCEHVFLPQTCLSWIQRSGAMAKECEWPRPLMSRGVKVGGATTSSCLSSLG